MRTERVPPEMVNIQAESFQWTAPAIPATADLPVVSGQIPASQTPPKEVLVLGVGSTLCGDDGLGIQALEMLSTYPLPAWVELACVGLPGWELPLWLKGRRKTILVDALDMGLPPGSLRRFDIEEVKLTSLENHLSLHETDLAGGLALAEALNTLPAELILLGVQPAQCLPGQELSPQVRKALPELISAILEEIQSTRRSHEETYPAD